MRELFSPGTVLILLYAVCRVGANDFSLNWYSYNETDGDFEMKRSALAMICKP